MKKVRLNTKRGRAFQGRSRGFTLIEVLVALALFAIIGIVFAGGLGTASRAVFIGDVRTNLESLASTQMEYIKNQQYIYYSESDHEDYDVMERDGYTVDVLVEPIDPETGQPYDEDGGVFEEDNGIQEITVTVTHENKLMITLVNYKVDR